MTLDRDLPSEDFFSKAGLEIFPTIFKLTFYFQEYAVTNHILNLKEELKKELGSEQDKETSYMSDLVI